jgi:hypothetical protein
VGAEYESAEETLEKLARNKRKASPTTELSASIFLIKISDMINIVKLQALDEPYGRDNIQKRGRNIS